MSSLVRGGVCLEAQRRRKSSLLAVTSHWLVSFIVSQLAACAVSTLLYRAVQTLENNLPVWRRLPLFLDCATRVARLATCRTPTPPCDTHPSDFFIRCAMLRSKLVERDAW
jgi:hypothetical protein